MPAYWNGHVYYAGNSDGLKDFALSSEPPLLSTTPTSSNETFGYPGATPAVSSNGNTGAVVWILDESAYSSTAAAPGAAILRAYDAPPTPPTCSGAAAIVRATRPRGP